MGFAHRTWRPASTHAKAISKWVSSGVKMVTTSPLFMREMAARKAWGSKATSSAGSVVMVRSISLYAAPIFRAMVSRTAGMRSPTASTRTILSISPRRRMSVNVMATTPAGLSGAAPAAVNTHLVEVGGRGEEKGQRGRAGWAAPTGGRQNINKMSTVVDWRTRRGTALEPGETRALTDAPRGVLPCADHERADGHLYRSLGGSVPPRVPGRLQISAAPRWHCSPATPRSGQPRRAGAHPDDADRGWPSEAVTFHRAPQEI